VKGVLVFIIEKMVAKILNLSKTRIIELLTKLTKEKNKERKRER